MTCKSANTSTYIICNSDLLDAASNDDERLNSVVAAGFVPEMSLACRLYEYRCIRKDKVSFLDKKFVMLAVRTWNINSVCRHTCLTLDSQHIWMDF